MNAAPVPELRLGEIRKCSLNRTILLEKLRQDCGDGDLRCPALPVVAFDRNAEAQLRHCATIYSFRPRLYEDAAGCDLHQPLICLACARDIEGLGHAGREEPPGCRSAVCRQP